MELQSDQRIIIRNGSQILTPQQYQKLRSELPAEYRVFTDVLITTGLRIVEFWSLKKNKHWYHRSAKVIDLPKEGAAKKPQCKTTDRTVRLSDRAIDALDKLFSDDWDVKDRNSFRGALYRAADRAGLPGKRFYKDEKLIGVEGINPKMFRKCIISHLVECRKDFGIDSLDITASMGHSEDTMIQNYLGIGFSKEAHDAMVEFHKGW